MPRYKGEIQSTEQPFRKRWTRGRGWESYRTIRGKNLQGELAGMQVNCNQIDYSSDGIYEEITGTIPAFNPEDPGGVEEGAPENIWELHMNLETISVLAHPSAKAMEVDVPGITALIKRTAEEWQSASSSLSYDWPAEWATIPAPYDAQAEHLVNLIMSDVTTFRIYQPVITLSQNVTSPDSSRWVYLSGSISTAPYVFPTTNALVERLNLFDLPMPFPFATILPGGAWLETPPNVRQTSFQRFDISQQWEWFLEIDQFLYPNTVT